MSFTRTLAAAAATVAVFAAPAAAQPRVPLSPATSSPAVSPYIGLLWGGAGPGLNYLSIVQPQLQFQQQANQIQQQLYQQGQQIQANNRALGADPFLPFTGRGATFMYYSHYYPALGGGGGFGGMRSGFGSGPATPAFARSSANQIGKSPQRPANNAGGAGGVPGR